MTAALNLDPHRTPTLDLRFPVVDVGPLPDACEQTHVGPPPPAHLPAVRPVCILPDLDAPCDEDGTPLEDLLSDLAANCSGDTHQSADDLWTLAGSQPHIKAICQLLGAAEMAIVDRDERIERLGATVQQLTKQLAASQGIGAGLERELGVARDAHIAAEVEVNVLTNRNENLDVLLRTERQRLEREAQMHRETMNRLLQQTAESFKLTKEVKRLTEEVRVLRAAAHVPKALTGFES